MNWGFFLYVIWFNPGQSAQYYALLQRYSPIALLTQNIAGAIAQGIGSAGFIWFALRAPNDETTSRWRPVELILPFIAIVLAGLLALSYANLLGYRTEAVTRAGVLSGIVVAASAFLILLARQNELPPQDYQRLRWVIWGCLIGLPALVFADAGTTTTLLNHLWPGYSPPEQLWGLLYLVNGVLCLLVSEAVRRPYVVKVSIPLRRVTILGLLLSLPVLFLHETIDHLREAVSKNVTLPAWAWIALAAAIIFLISKVHDSAAHYLDWLFNRSVAKAGERLGDAVLKAKQYGEIEGELVQGVRGALGLTSASVFREQDHVFRRMAADHAWDNAARTLDPNDPMLERAQAHRPYDVDNKAAVRTDLPGGLMRPILAVPVGDRLRCLGLALYGPHATGNALSHDERSMLAELAEKAASALMKLSDEQLRHRIAALESELESITAGLPTTGQRSSVPPERASDKLMMSALGHRRARIEMNEPRVADGIYSDDRARERVQRFARLRAAGALVIASALRSQANAQEAASAPPARSTAAVPAPRTDTASKFDVSVAASITSDYNYRGYTLSDHKPSVSTNFEATYNILFAAIDAASVQIPMLSQLQMTDYAGIRPVFGPITVETGVAYYSYPGSVIDTSYPEYYVAPKYALSSKFTIGVNVYYAPNYSRTGAWENFDSIDAKYTFDSSLTISGELGRQSFGTTKATAMDAAHKLPDYTYWNLGFSYTYKALKFDMRYFATTLSKQSCFLITGTGQAAVGSNGCNPALVATLSWSTSLSGLK